MTHRSVTGFSTDDLKYSTTAFSGETKSGVGQQREKKRNV